MSDLNRSIPMLDAGQAFIVTIGIPHGSQTETNRYCARALRALERAGFHAGATSDEAIATIAEQQKLVDGIVTGRNPEENP